MTVFDDQQSQLEESLRFETLLADLSSKFVNLPANEVDREIENAQRRICECLRFDVSSLWQWSPENPDEHILSHKYYPLDLAIPKLMKASEHFPWHLRQIFEGRVVAFSSLEELPPEAARDKEVLRHYGIRSVLTVPLSTGGGPAFGSVSFDTMHVERTWPEAIVNRLKLVAQIFANAIERKRSDEALRASELRLSLAAASADAGLWTLDMASRRFWATDKALELFGAAPHEPFHLEKFFEYVHPDDRDRVRLVIEQVFKTEQDASVEYRIIRGDGQLRWLLSRGRPYFSSTGAPESLMGISVDITERKTSEAQLQEGLRFETLLSELSSKFINLPPDQVDHEIGKAQRRVCEHLEIDVSSLWQCSPETPSIFVLTHSFTPPGFPRPPERMEAQEYFPWCLEKLTAEGILRVESFDNLPPEAGRDKEVWQSFGLRTTLSLQLWAGNGPSLGALTFNTLQERTWPDALVQRLQLVAQIFANALMRKRADLILQESEWRQKLAAESADAGLWTLDMKSRRFWITDKTRELLGLAPLEPLDMEKFLGYVHPEDRDRIRLTLEQAFETRQDVSAEYRIMRGDGQVRWILSRGRAYFCSTGSPESLMGISVDITKRKQEQEELAKSYAEVKQLKEALQAENVSLRRDLQISQGDTEILGRSSGIQHVLAMAAQVAPTDSTVLILGETGTGKELIASAIHNQSKRRDRPMIRVNCAAIPSTLIESELFGRERGAYTGALTKQIGRFEAADRSTLFLDEIGELPPEVQVKLLRFLQERKIERLGAPKSISLDVRIIAATNCDLQKAIRDGRFREDLYYRLSIFPITMPPLRERREDIPLLVGAFVNQFGKVMGKTITSIPPSTMDALQRYSWPGNVRELHNVVERAMILARDSKLVIEIPAHAGAPNSPRLSRLEDVERDHILRVLEQTGWRVQGNGGAAEILGLKRTTLESRMAKLGIRRPGS